MLPKPQLLIDGDITLFRCSAATEFACDWGDDVWVLSGNLQQAKDAFTSQVEGFKTALGSDDVVIVLSGKENFRYTLTSTYKSNRKGTRKPLVYNPLREWVETEYKAISKPSLEADDYLGILATKPNGIPRIIVSEDKDLKTIPGQLYRQGELIEVTADEADEFWMIQTLMGDATDGYKGCPGIGAVNAQKIVSKPGDRWENVRLAFIKAGLTDDDALLQARLSRILRWSDWDSTNQQPILWTPEGGK